MKEIHAFIGADTLNYLSEEALFTASGRYPTDLYGHEEVYNNCL